ncbi:MAG: hypothetical protein IPJ41_08385 [Phycisphaerales bacterium]|nr:hypothetical protein [Phycisphaerales bacterium]
MRRSISRFGPASRVLVLAAASLAAAPPPTGAQTADPQEYAARAVARVGLLDLRTRPNPTPDDYLIARTLIETAADLEPTDEAFVRGAIQAAWAAGETDRVDSLTQRLIKLDPTDTVCQLRLVSSRIRSLQTAEERLAAYDRVIGPGGAALDASVRSRLALDAALLCRERADSAGFTSRLTQAMQLDSTNKEAAAMAWSYFGPFAKSPADRLELLINLLMADPSDPSLYRQMATELALGGEFVQARRFHQLAMGLMLGADPRQTDRLMTEASVIRWQVEGPKVVIDSLNKELAKQRGEAASKILQYEQAKMPTDTLPKPETIMLAPVYNQMRLVAAIMADDRDTIGATLRDMTSMFGEAIARASKLDQLSTQEEKQQRMLELWGELSQQLIAIAWADAQSDSLKQFSENAAKTFGPDSAMAKLLGAWAELRLGDAAKAETLFRQIAADSPLNQVGLGITLEKLGRKDEAVEIYRRLAKGLPMSLSGVWARYHCRELTGEDPMQTPERAALAALAQQVPAWIDRMAMDPRSFMTLQASLTDNTISATERPGLKIRLTNISPRPLGVGGDRTLNSRLLFNPRLQTGTGQDFIRTTPEVLELDRRLRLMPNESIDVVIWPDPGLTGWLAEVGAAETVRERWRVLQGYVLDQNGVPYPGPLCLETETDRLVREPLPLGKASGQQLADALDAAGSDDLPGVIAAIRARLLAPVRGDPALTLDEVNRIAVVAADRYTALPLGSRAAMLAVLPPAAFAAGMEPFDAQARAETDPTLLPLVLVTRVVKSDDALIDQAAQSEHDDLRAFARALRERLLDPRPTFSRLNPNFLRATADFDLGSG